VIKASKTAKTTEKPFLRVPKRYGCLVSGDVGVECPLVSFEIDCVVGSMVWRWLGVGLALSALLVE
jgi:hypothetical protein